MSNTQSNYAPSSFLGMFCHKQKMPNERQLLQEFVSVAGLRPQISVTSKSFIAYLAYSPTTKVAVDHENHVTLLLHGEIYNRTDNSDHVEFMIRELVERGLGCVKDINGSYAALLLDTRNDTAQLITDRLNTRKVFCSEHKDNHWISTSLHTHPTSDVDVDPIGAAHYLANGVIHNNRTLFKGVRVLERASIHRLTQNGFCGTRYWSYKFAGKSASMSQKEQSAELESLLIDSVRVRLNGKLEVFLSLSGGYDATGILGILARELSVPRVRCFSYGLGNPKVNSDEYVSRQMANHFGFDHKVVNSYQGNLLDVIRHNAAFGQGIAHFCDEVDAWMNMAYEFSAGPPSVLFVADECFGWEDRELHSETDVLDSLSINNFHALRRFRPLLPKETYDLLFDGLNDDIQQMLRRCSCGGDYHDLKDVMYLDQRLNNVILPWREFFAGRFIAVRNPFLDNSILDFIMTVPSSLRRGKRLYKETITAMFPELFQFKRSRTSSYVVNWANELQVHSSAISTLLLSKDSRLDKVIPPEAILRLLFTNKTGKFRKFLTKSRRRVKWMLRGSGVTRGLVTGLPSVFGDRVECTTLLKRALVMRLALR